MNERPAPEATESSGPGLTAPPSISLPKGGGAIRGIGEKFAANPVTGTGSMSVPLATSPGRSDFGPQLLLSYDSGAGNSAFGLGWNLSLPAITRKTDKGLPKYQDADESDVFILSGAEDLVPVGDATNDLSGNFSVRRYRPRIEGLFARIERWAELASRKVYWQSISKDNITTLYGRTPESCIVDPTDPTRIFSWLICESYDDKGNAIRYEYKTENSDGVDLSAGNEKNRSRSAQRYLKRIKYGNKTPRRPNEDLAQRTDWMFEVVFDYGEHYTESHQTGNDQSQPTAVHINDAQRGWATRPDPLSSYRSGFEVRTNRLCQRVLMFHHFDELGIADYLVRATHFKYRYGPSASFLAAVTHSGYIRQGNTYLKTSFPPLEFEYSEANIDETVREVDEDSLENLPYGLDGSHYQWIDLDGEGLSGILTEQGGAWFYKRNLSALPVLRSSDTQAIPVRFAPVECLATIPSPANLSTGQQLLDLTGNGQLDVVEFDGPLPGFFERTTDEGWESFRSFASLPNVAWKDPNLKFVDLTGDGHADILVTEDEVLTWYASLAEKGFGPASKVRQAFDEETGPRLVFADGTQSIYLSDLSGDGLTDLVRIRNGEVCYWPNLGYGRFGEKVTMDHAPWFDAPDQFDQKRIRLADIDGSGVVDIIYLAADGVRLYFNQTGNRWSDARVLANFPVIDNLSSVQVADLLGNGTACLVWSSPLPGDVRRHMRYIDLMGGQKPHLLTAVKNNLGAVTRVEYAPSTRFYLQDRADGNPWITKLPFPVHCVEKVTVSDKWRKTTFSTTYSYHHGYFDGVEREFRGFGRVEQVDVASYGEFAQSNAAGPYITEDKILYQPPVKIVTWFHTGAFVKRETILSHFKQEYFPNWFESLHPGEANVLGAFREGVVPEPDLVALDLTTDEWREALRSCKGMLLRQEVYELDVESLEHGEHRPVKLFSAATHNCRIQLLQPKVTNRHAVFLVTESEGITYNYELDLRPTTVRPDPRIAHTLNLATDQYGNVLQAVAVVYPRLGQFDDPLLAHEDLERIRDVQREMHLVYSENRYTDDVDEPDHRRLRVPCETLTYELTGIQPAHTYVSLQELRDYRLSEVHQTTGSAVAEIPYYQIPIQTAPQKRCVEHVRMLFFQENLRDPLPFRTLNRLGLLYENYKLALTEDLLSSIFTDKLTPDVRRQLGDASISGYLSGADVRSRFGEAPGQYWIRSGIAGFRDDAADHFYLPDRYTDPFGNVTTVQFDNHDLFVKSSTDALGNVTLVEQFDFRVLAPRRVRDINDNLSEVGFDILGLPAASAVMGKGGEGDDLSAFDNAAVNPDLATLNQFFTQDYDEVQARRLLGNATARHLVYFGEVPDADGSLTWGVHPACSCGIGRERHVGQLAAGQISPLQTAFEYTDGLGSVLVKKVQAEPEGERGPLRWITSGKTVLNNKGKPVKQYEPYFSERGQRFEEPREVGVTPLLYYDALGRLIRTESPDGSFSRVEFSPWHVAHYDANDSVLESGNVWYSAQHPLDPGRHLPTDPITGQILATPEQRAAWLAAQHANTPSLSLLDSLGREVVGIAHNKYRDRDGVPNDEKCVTFNRLDAEGKPLWVRDARGNLVMQYITPIKPTRAGDEADPSRSEAMPLDSVPCYDISGNLLFQHSMDAGDRWMLMDAAGKPMLTWDFNERQTDGGAIGEQRLFSTEYDALHRPTAQWLRINGEPRQMVERFDYRDARTADGAANSRLLEDRNANLLGQLVRHYDSSGLVETIHRDFKGNVLETRRTLAGAYNASVVDWSPGSHTAELETETFVQLTEYDALNRMVRQYNWHKVIPDSRVAVYEPRYNARGLLASEDLFIRAVKKPEGYEGGQRITAIRSMAYDAKGQKERIDYGNGTTTYYDYDPETFRLRQLRTTRSSFTEPFPGYHSSLRNPDVVQQLSYTYDPTGNITEIYDEAYQPVFFRNQLVEPRSRYTYDALYRLIEANGREHANVSAAPGQFQNDPDHVGFPIPSPGALRNYTQQYRYDAVGNIDEMQHVAGPTGSWTRHYEYSPENNRLLRTWEGANHWEDATATNKVTYRYDTHGSMLNLADVPAEYRLRWDYRDMIHSVNLGGGGWAYYNYEAGKERTRKVITNEGGVKQWERLYLGGMEVYRRYGPGGIVDEIETHHLFLGEQRVLLVEDVLPPDNAGLGVGARFRYQYGNHLGSACVELDETAALITYEEYHPYGTSAYQAGRSAAEVSLKRYRYTGKERDGETGFSYHAARYYAPWIARWTSSDPAGLVDGPNIYSYVRNSPVRSKDSTGKSIAELERRLGGIRSEYGASRESYNTEVGSIVQATRAASSGVELTPYQQRIITATAENVQDNTRSVNSLVADTRAAVIQAQRDYRLNPNDYHGTQLRNAISVDRAAVEMQRTLRQAADDLGNLRELTEYGVPPPPRPPPRNTVQVGPSPVAGNIRAMPPTDPPPSPGVFSRFRDWITRGRGGGGGRASFVEHPPSPPPSGFVSGARAAVSAVLQRGTNWLGAVGNVVQAVEGTRLLAQPPPSTLPNGATYIDPGTYTGFTGSVGTIFHRPDGNIEIRWQTTFLFLHGETTTVIRMPPQT